MSPEPRFTQVKNQHTIQPPDNAKDNAEELEQVRLSKMNQETNTDQETTKNGSTEAVQHDHEELITKETAKVNAQKKMQRDHGPVPQ
ncbi:hypothetical protein RDI58_001053 [Solanum bulbocastanum]|uniref:Uncharacterized protein n=1 Tax=Solanum bulbocastanum TaxID=147425 RepID=A0AAN8U4B9_SOLBU